MSKIRLYGATSGYVDVAAPAVADDATLTLPTGAVGFGKMLQVVSTAKTDTFSTTSTSFTDVTGLTVSITPAAATSKVLIIAQVALSSNANGTSLRVNGGNATNYVGDASGSRIQAIIGGSSMAIAGFQDAMTLVYLDSPATTSSTTYAVQIRVASSTAYINRSDTDVDSADFARGASSITVVEVAA